MTWKHDGIMNPLRVQPTALILAWVALVAVASQPDCQSASVTFDFRPAPGVVPDYEMVNVWLLADETCAYWEKALKWETREKSFRKTFGDLEPGDYYYLISTNWKR